jgi:hypothetical protein
MYEIHDEPDYLQLSITGSVDQQGLYKAQNALLKHPYYPCKNSLLIFDKEFVCGFSSIDMFEMISRIKSFFPVGATKEKEAVFASNGLHFAFFKLYCEEAEREGISFTIKPFRSFAAAKTWLMTEPE